jgi:nitrate reductase NapE component
VRFDPNWMRDKSRRLGPFHFVCSVNMQLSLALNITPLGIVAVVGPFGFQVDWNEWYWNRKIWIGNTVRRGK